MHNEKMRTVIPLLISLASPSLSMTQRMRPITAEDCVTVRYLNDDGIYSPLQINGQGTRLAYVIKSPNLKQNRNDIELYIKDLSSSPAKPSKLIFAANTISEIHWADDGEHIFFLTNEGQYRTVSSIDVVTGEHVVVVRGESDIVEYSIDATGATIVFATEDRSGAQITKLGSEQIAAGYRIPFQSPDQNRELQGHLFLTRRAVSGSWSNPMSITVKSPFTGLALTSFAFTPNLRLSVSPDGKKLVFVYLIQERLPAEWTNSLIGSLTLKAGSPPMTALLVDLETMQGTLPFKTAWAFSLPMWSSDSRSFALVATSPIGSVWEQADAHDHQDTIGATHLFWIEPDTGRIEEILHHVANMIRGPLWWGPNGHMLVETDDDKIERLSRDGNVWHTLATFRNPVDDGSPFTPAVSNGSEIIREREGPATPPELVWYHLEKPGIEVFSKLDPQFDMLTLAPSKKVEWETSSGYKISGLLFVPPDYEEGQAYPLVVQGYHDVSQKFFCDHGAGHWPSLVPQPLADAGIMYLIRTSRDDEYKRQDRDHRPGQYPGGIGEAALQMDIWDSAVKAFAARGWIDPSRVGIIGFSRTGWYTEFTLAHSKMSYAAATDTDNVSYSLGEYWLLHQQGDIQGYDAMYGGPPYGDTLRSWMEYAPTFNIDRIHTPVLMEEMGYGISYEDMQAPPLNLISHFELFTGLNRLNKPVELYYYPREGHTPDHPQARLASLQRNVDWYRFWLQDYERPNAEDPEQYKRWEHLRDLQHREANIQKSANGGTN